jgi:hypothetical protein
MPLYPGVYMYIYIVFYRDLAPQTMVSSQMILFLRSLYER